MITVIAYNTHEDRVAQKNGEEIGNATTRQELDTHVDTAMRKYDGKVFLGYRDGDRVTTYNDAAIKLS